MTDSTSRPGLDVLIVGGGASGLAAAIWLARYRRRTLVVDAGVPRNTAAASVHGYPGLPDVPPAELHARLLAQATDAGAEVVRGTVTAVRGVKDEFRVEMGTSSPLVARRVLLAYGQRDALPDVPGLANAYGTTVHHCPDCDGPVCVDRRVGVIGSDRHAAALALFLLTWTPHVTLLTGHEPVTLDGHTRETLAAHGIGIRTEPIERVEQRDGYVRAVHFSDASPLAIDRIFFHSVPSDTCPLATSLGCSVDAGYIVTDSGQQTTVPGIYAAGDITGHPHLAITAAAEGVAAALAIHRSLLPPDFELNH